MKVTDFNNGTSYNGILPVRPDMSEDKVLIRKLKMYAILFFVLFVLFFICTVIVSVILGINIKQEQHLEEELMKCIKIRDSVFFSASIPPDPS